MQTNGRLSCRIVDEENAEQLKEESDKIYRITCRDTMSFLKLTQLPFAFSSVNSKKLRARVRIKANQINELIGMTADLNVEDFQEFPFTLEDYFMNFYKTDTVFEGVK